MGATFVTSSPNTNTASAVCTSCSDGERAGPFCKMSNAKETSRGPLLSDIPAKKRSGPTRVRRAKLASSDARGDPIPIMPELLLSTACKWWSTFSLLVGSCELPLFIGPDERFSDALIAVDEFVAEASAVAEEIAVDLAVVPVVYPPQRTVTFAGDRVAAHAAVDAHRWRGLQIPFAGVMISQGFVGKDTCRANLDKIAAEFILQSTVLKPSKIKRLSMPKTSRSRPPA